MTEIKKIAHNTIIQIIGKTITIAIALFTFGLIARYLGQEGFGYYTTIYAFLSIFGILFDLGLQMTTTQLISDPAENESEILSNALSIRFIASIFFLSLAPIFVLFFPYPTLVKVGVALAAVGFIFSSLLSTLTSLFQKRLMIQKVAIADVLAKILFLIIILAAIRLDLGLLGVIFAIVVDSFFTFAILFYFATKITVIKPAINLAVWKKIFSHTWPIALTIGLNLVYFKGDTFIMSLLRSQAEVGLYGAPYKILEVLINMAYLFLGLILPLLAGAAAIKNLDRLKLVIQSTFDFLIVLTVPMIFGGYFLGRRLMVMMAGENFLISGDIIKILFLATGIIFISGLFGYVVVALNQQKKMIKFYAVNAVISIIGYLIFINYYSYWGAAWMTVFTESFILFSAAYVMHKNIKFLPKSGLLSKALLSSLVMSVWLYFFPGINMFVSIFAGIIIYFSALYLLGGLNKELIKEIITISKN